MKRRTGFFVLLVCILVLPPALLVFRSTTSGDMPSLAAVESMSKEDAANALAGFRRKDVLDAWGQPREVHDALSNTLIDTYDAGTRGGWIAVYYDASKFSGPVDPASPDADTLPVKLVELQTIQ